MPKSTGGPPASDSPLDSLPGDAGNHPPDHNLYSSSSVPTSLSLSKLAVILNVGIASSSQMNSSSTVVLFFALFACAFSLKSDRVLDAFSLDLLDSTNRPHGCPECTASCPPLNGCPNRAFDGCGCCELCVGPKGSSCGPGSGVCDKGLHCQPLDSPDSGICKAKKTDLVDRCLHAKCNVTFAVTCPEDSRIHELQGADDSCCPKQLECRCDPEKCDRLVRHCPSGLELVLVAEGQLIPGKCCGIFECRKKHLQCENVQCSDVGSEEPCPEDSFRPPRFIPKDGCCPISSECKCRAAICEPVACAENEVATVKKKGNGVPGQCCDEFVCSKRISAPASSEKQPADVGESFHSQCHHSGKLYDDGDTWHPTNCRICECRKGIAACRDQHCPNVPKTCRWTEKLDNDCCPVCRGCKSDDNSTHEINETWQKDKCTTCTCGEDGREHCQTSICVKTCANPRPVEGQCCDVCDEPTVIEASSTCPSLEHCPLRCENGLDFKDWCYVCACKPSTPPLFIGSDYDDCPKLNETNCNKVCAHGYMSDERGCKVCKCANCPHPDHCYKHCLYGFETNTIGCPVCKCRAKTVVDARLTNSKPDFNKCVSIGEKGSTVLRDSGEMWTDDRCRQCFCEDKVEFCTLISCPEKPDSCPAEHWVKHKGDCCPRCTDHPNRGLSMKHSQTVCHSPGTGRLFVDGETWQLDQCISCTCRVGQVLCSVKKCDALSCDNPIADENNPCCKKCPENEVSLLAYEDNDMGGYCTDEHGIGRAFGQSWWRDECTSCKCEKNSRINCYTQKCPLLRNCAGRPLTVKNLCCPICSDKLTTNSMCSYENSTYRVHEEWREDTCTRCICKPGGAVECIKTQCPPCQDRQPSDGPCCPMCENSYFGGHETEVTVVREQESRNMTLLIVGLCTCVLLIALGFLAFSIKRSVSTSFMKEAPPRDCSILISKKCVGSSSRLNTWKDPIGRRGSVDGVSESLLSTVSDSSSAPSSNSSGIGPHSDTLPLTKSKSQPLGGRAKSTGP
ncbi:hypothetical protein QR680_005271 [Steinernema hermaphroditum]|uniref:VWFC domain-containing protein n=1 Tax=Steinernema hermaphroditum TaxID=289476 RepID=A0AA39HTM0_9BILA|nr:hypothetical protein QR680_005271 [Steinernema hermaphroditum]